MLDRFKVAWLWVAAYRLSAQRRYEEALRTLRSVQVSESKKEYWQLFEILQLTLLEKHVEALEMAMRYVDAMKRKSPLTPNQRYFVAFARCCGATAFASLSPGAALPPTLRQELNDLDVENVSGRWKRTFSLRERALDWDEPV